MTRHRPSLRALAVLLPLAFGLAGCASKVSMDARYEASLQHWKGATRAELIAAWGKPLLAATAGRVETLTWVAINDIRTPQPLPNYATNSGGATMVTAATVAPVVPMRCTTHFELRDGVVTAWTFEGLACGAPT